MRDESKPFYQRHPRTAAALLFVCRTYRRLCYSDVGALRLVAIACGVKYLFGL